MEYRYKISEQPNKRLKEFPFYAVTAGSNEAFFVPFSEAGDKGSVIRYYARLAGVKIKTRQRVENGVLGYFVWVKKIDPSLIVAQPTPVKFEARNSAGEKCIT